MKQVLQSLINGKIRVIDVPPPILTNGKVLIRNLYSAVSPGTEGSTIRTARKSLFGKIKERPLEAKQALELAKNEGPVQAYERVMGRLEAYSPLGYSSVGEVIDMALDVAAFSKGDLVACGGAGYANHAEIIAVPKNLCARVPRGADLKASAYATLGAIALQGVRQADPKIGETCAVIGLGLIGQLTSQILKAGGIITFGIDIDSWIVSIAKKHCVDFAFLRREASLAQKIYELTNGVGVDAVIITAATRSQDPINFAGLISRKKGRIVVVGDVPTGFERKIYYRKELELRMSCSCGPGRYDPNYEENGIDYPLGYVRWTEKRNMEAFLETVSSHKISLDYLTTHIFELEDASKAYELILQRKEPSLGVIIRYPPTEKKHLDRIEISRGVPAAKIKLGFIGIGNYATNFLLPNLRKDTRVSFGVVMDASGVASRKVAEKYRFKSCTNDEKDIFQNPEINTVFIATRHDSHARYVLESLKAGKHCAVEKPLCLNKAELEEIRGVYEETRSASSPPILMVGFNRRFSSLTAELKKHLDEGPMAMIYRINAGYIPVESWVQDPRIGGGRIIGEVCHFVDYLAYVNGSLPESVFASSLPDPHHAKDTLAVNLKFRNGSIGTISYFSCGSKKLFKEYIEVYRSSLTGIIRDFRQLELFDENRLKRKKLWVRDKGQKKMIRAFLDSVAAGGPSPISFEEIYYVTLATFKILDSLRAGTHIPTS